MPARNARALSHRVCNHSFTHSCGHLQSIYPEPTVCLFLGARTAQADMTQFLPGETQGSPGDKSFNKGQSTNEEMPEVGRESF